MCLTEEGGERIGNKIHSGLSLSVCVVSKARMFLCHQAINSAVLRSVSSHVEMCVFTLLWRPIVRNCLHQPSFLRWDSTHAFVSSPLYRELLRCRKCISLSRQFEAKQLIKNICESHFILIMVHCSVFENTERNQAW